MIRSLFVCGVALALLAVPGRSDAALFTATYSGQVGSGDAEPLVSFPVGTAIAFEVTFDDLFLTDDEAWFYDNTPRATTGVLTVGGVQTQLTSYDISSVTHVGPNLVSVTYSFAGVGPIVDGGEFYRLRVPLTLSMDLDDVPFFGYDYAPGPPEFRRYAYAAERPFQFDVTPAAVPAPALGWLMLSGLGAVVARRLKAPRRAQ
jgi:hypothetical protein